MKKLEKKNMNKLKGGVELEGITCGAFVVVK
jgi:hypothetical protein